MSSVYGLLLVGSLEALLKSVANSAGAGTAPGSVAAMVMQVKGRARVNFNYPLYSATDIGRLFSHHGLRILTTRSISARWLLAFQLPDCQMNYCTAFRFNFTLFYCTYINIKKLVNNDHIFIDSNNLWMQKSTVARSEWISLV